jgi:Ion channel
VNLDTATQDRHALLLLLSLLLFLILGAFVSHDRTGEVILAVALGIALGAATMELSEKKSLRTPGIVLAFTTVAVIILSAIHPIEPLLAANWTMLMVSFGFIAWNLFLYLGRRGRITNGRIYASVSLYLMIATFYFALFNLLETVNHGSFAESGAPPGTFIARRALLYFSLITVTTVGYGDVVPVTQPARIFAALEGVTGVLYIAITVARLVAGYQVGQDEN